MGKTVSKHYQDHLTKDSPITHLDQHVVLSHGHSPIPPYPCPFKFEGCMKVSLTLSEHRKHLRDEHNA